MKLTKNSAEHTNFDVHKRRKEINPLLEIGFSRKVRRYSPFEGFICGALVGIALFTSLMTYSCKTRLEYTAAYLDIGGKQEEVVPADVKSEADVYFDGRDAKFEQKIYDEKDEPKDVQDDPPKDKKDTQEDPKPVDVNEVILDTHPEVKDAGHDSDTFVPETNDTADLLDLQDLGTDTSDQTTNPEDCEVEFITDTGFDLTDTQADGTDTTGIEGVWEIPLPEITDATDTDSQPTDAIELTDKFIFPDQITPLDVSETEAECETECDVQKDVPEIEEVCAETQPETIVDTTGDPSQEIIDTVPDNEVAPDVQPEVDVYTPPWYDPWTDCITVTIVGEFPEGYSHQLNLDSSEIDLSLFNPDGSDVRFYEGDCEGGPIGGILYHWIEKWELDAFSTVWVKTMTANAPSMAMVFGNAEAENLSNISTTFLFADDFDGIFLDFNKWKKIGGGTLIFNNGILEYSGYSANGKNTYGDVVESNQSFPPGVEFRVRRIWDHNGANIAELGFGSNADGTTEPMGPGYIGEIDWSSGDNLLAFKTMTKWPNLTVSKSEPGSYDWKTLIIKRSSVAEFTLLNDDGSTNLSAMLVTHIPDTNLPLHFGGTYAGYHFEFGMKIDYVLVRSMAIDMADPTYYF